MGGTLVCPGAASRIIRALGSLVLILLVAAAAGCRREDDSPPEAPPLALEHLSTIPTNGWASGSEARLAFDGTTMYVPLGACGMDVYAIGDPAHPELLCRVGIDTLGGQGGAVAAAGGRAFVAAMGAEGDSVIELDMSTPGSPSAVCRFSGVPEYDQLVLRGSRLYIQSGSCTDYDGGVYVFAAAQSPPQLAGRYLADLIDPGFHVTDAGRVFQARTPEFADDFPSIDVVDMVDPAAPKVLSTWKSQRGLNVWDIDVRQERAYCAGYWGGILVLRGADKERLELEAEYDWSERGKAALSIAAAPPYVFVARGDTEGGADDFQVFRQDGSSLVLEREIAAELPVYSVAVSGNLLVTVEQEPPIVELPRKILKLYRIFAQ